MKALLRGGALVLLGSLASGFAVAQNLSCPAQPYEYRITFNNSSGGGTYDSGWVGSTSGLADAALAYCVDRFNANLTCKTTTMAGGPPAYTYAVLGTCAAPGTYSSNNAAVQCTFRRTQTSNGALFDFFFTHTVNRRNTVTCPEDECEYDGMKNWGVSTGGPYPTEGYCEGNCKVTPSQQSCSGPVGTQTCTAMLSYDEEIPCTGGGGEPSGNTADTPDEDEPTNEKCIDVGDGEYCASPTGDKDCGYMNDTFICLAKVQPDECKVLGDGGRVCGGAANTTPPVPDSGTPGVLAGSDGEMSAVAPAGGGGTTNYNYYSSTTVAGSSRDTGADGAAPSGGSPGYGADSGGGGDGLPAECEGSDCSADLPELEEIGTLSEAMGAFWADLQEVPIVAAATDVAPSFGAGSCPAWQTSVPLYSEEIDVDFTSICDIWTDISPALGAVCLVMFGLLAFRVLFSA